MDIKELVVERLRTLPPDKQKEVLEFVEFLRQRNASPHPRRSLKGLWSDLGIDISEQDLAEARREMWGNFPHEV